MFKDTGGIDAASILLNLTDYCRIGRNGTPVPATGYRAILRTWYFNSC